MGVTFDLDSRTFAGVLLIEALATWQKVFLPCFTNNAKSRWGEKWESECSKLLSRKMKEHVEEGDGWDLYRIVSVMMRKPAIFMPEYDKLSDCAREMHRNRLHHLKFLRDKMAHSFPSIAECLAGAMAAHDLLASHSIHAEKSILTCIDTLRTLMPANDRTTVEVKVPKISVLLAVLINAFDAFVTKVGGKARSMWSDQRNVPNHFGDVAGLIRQLDPQGQKGCNEQLKKWSEYKNWDYKTVKDTLVEIKKSRNTLHHKPLSFSPEMVSTLLSNITKVLDELKLDKSSLEQLQARTHSIHCSDVDLAGLRVSREVNAAAVHMQIGFSARNLTGRDALIKTLTDDIVGRANRGEHSRTALTGRSGVGKTVLAREICNKLLEALPLQAMMLGTSRGTMQTELARLGRAFTPNLPQESDEEQAVEAALRFFASTTGYILLVDDAEDIDELWTLLPRDSGGRQVGHVLFTTQKRMEFAQDGLLTAVHEVCVLSTDESMELLGSKDTRDDTTVRNVVVQDSSIDLRGFVERDLGNLPLAVSMLKTALKGLDVPCASKVMDRLRQCIVPELGGYQESSLRYLRTLEGLVQELIEGRLKRRFTVDVYTAAIRLLSMLCVLDADGTPDELIAPASGSEAMFKECIAALVDVGLVDWDSLTGLSSMHALYQKCTFHYFQRGLCVSLISWGCIWHTLEREFTSLSSDPRAHGRKLRRLYRSARCAANCMGDKTIQEKLGQSSVQLASTHRARLHTAIGRVGQDLIHDWETAKTYYTSALEIYESSFPNDHPDVAASLSDLASFHKEMGQLKQALQLEERALKINEARLGPDHLVVASSLNNLGLIHQNMGHLTEALPLLERALQISEATQDPNHPDVATHLNNVAVIHNDMGHPRVALPLHQRALAIREKTLDSHHVVASLNNLASLYKDMGHLKDALPLHERALAISEATLGPDHPDVAASLNNLATLHQTHQTMDHLKEALPLYERALAISEATFGPDHPNVAMNLSNLASLLQTMGQDEQALPLQEQALTIKEATFGPHHPEVATSLNNLASLRRAMGHLEEALTLFERALAINKATFGPDHPKVAINLSNLASLHQAMGQSEKALPLHELALVISEATVGPDHPDIVPNLSNLALLYQAMGHLKKALPLHKRALAISKTALGPDHPDLVDFLYKLALLHQEMGHRKQALPLHEQALAINTAMLGANHSEVATSLYYLATLHQEMGHLGEALPLHERALKIRVGAHSPDNPSLEVVASLSSLAWLYQDMRQYQQALPLHERALAFTRRMLGPDHPDVATGLYNLASLHQAMGQHGQALALHEQALAIREAKVGPDHPVVAASLNQLAVLYNSMGQPRRAFSLYKRALVIVERYQHSS